MIKRKWANSDKISNKRRKTINLPDLDVSDFVFHETTNSNSFNDSPMKFEPKVESDDEDLPEAILNSDHNDERIKKGDILWVKHNAKYCYWPAYVKAVMGQKVSIYYISFHKFTQGEKALKFNLRSKKIKRFNCKEHKSLLEAGRKHCEETGSDLSSFNNAVDLADTYSLFNRPFKNETEVYKYFNSNGLSLCYQKCLEHDTGISDPLVAVSMGSCVTSGNHVTSGYPSTIDNPTIPDETLTPANPMTPGSPTSLEKLNTSKNDMAVFQNQPGTSNKPVTSKKDNAALKCFNSQNKKIVTHILSGKTDKLLRNILNKKVKSKRMLSYLRKWRPKGSSEKDPDYVYFQDERQLKDVCLYLQCFITENYGDLPLVKSDDLIFRVLLPESTISAISKVRRRTPPDALQIYERGFKGRRLTSDPCFTTPLSMEEESSMKRRIKYISDNLSQSLPI